MYVHVGIDRCVVCLDNIFVFEAKVRCTEFSDIQRAKPSRFAFCRVLVSNGFPVIYIREADLSITRSLYPRSLFAASLPGARREVCRSAKSTR